MFNHLYLCISLFSIIYLVPDSRSIKILDMGKFIFLILFTFMCITSYAQVTCEQSIYGTHINIFPHASNEGLTTPILVSDKPEYAAYLQSPAFCSACLGTNPPGGIDCSDFKFDTNITTDSISACLNVANPVAFRTKKAISFSLVDFTMVKRSYKHCEIRGKVMDYEPCLFIFETACAKHVAELGEPHDCEELEDYYPPAGNPSPEGDDFFVTHKPNLDYLLDFYNCPASDAYQSNCPTALHSINTDPPAIPPQCAHGEDDP
ncbi:hypothetical protein N9N67_12430 [Bacteriovoracaceae bacterium]|nr:hypothetical protein [Bacteriovoracaceae bacterium]